MAMSASTLATELRHLTPVATEAAAIVNLANAYGVFAAEAQANGVTISSPAVAAGKLAMQAALVGMNAPGAGALKMQNAVIAFWGAVALLLAGAFTGATVITPPPNAGLVAALAVVFASNTSSALNINDATQSVANVFYAQAIIGGTVTFPPSLVAPLL